MKGLVGVGVFVGLWLVIPAWFDRATGERILTSQVLAAQNAWTSLGGPVKNAQSVYVDVDASRHARSPIIAAGKSGVFLAWTEINSHGISQIHFGEWNGKKWFLHPQPLNRDRDHHASDLSLGMAGENPVLAWVEWNPKKQPQVYIRHRIKGQWVISENPMNIDPQKQSANPVIAGNGKRNAFLAWSERDKNRVFQVYVKQSSNSNWFSVGHDSLNENPSMDGIEPALALDGELPYIAWMEFSKNHVYQIFVKTWTGASWDLVGSSLNVNPNNHALRPSIAVINHRPVVAWTEIGDTGVSTLHLKRWTGNKWELLGSALNMDPSRHSLSPVLRNAGEDLYLAWGEQDTTNRSRVFLKKWREGKWKPVPSPLEATGNRLSVSPSITTSENGIFMAWKELNPDGFFQVSVKQNHEK